jgi:hypothetical protein
MDVSYSVELLFFFPLSIQPPFYHKAEKEQAGFKYIVCACFCITSLGWLLQSAKDEVQSTQQFEIPIRLGAGWFEFRVHNK